MKHAGVLARSVYNGVQRGACAARSCKMAARGAGTYPECTSEMPLQRCLLVSKMTRYEHERHRHAGMSEGELERALRRRGTDYDALLAPHRTQKAFEAEVARTLTEMGLQVRVASRWSYCEELIKWCDVVIPCGGDGTFLLAASKLRDIDKPVIGFNSAPARSVGRLCLPRWCSADVRGAVQSLKEGRFRWMHRSRIRTIVTCEATRHDTVTPYDLHTLQLTRYAAQCRSLETPELPEAEPAAAAVEAGVGAAAPRAGLATRLLPYLALNEVFIGESVSARVSHLQLSVDGSDTTHTKSSGLCVTTGTGSTSWHLSINCLRTQSVQELMRLFAQEYGMAVDTSAEKARMLTERYNQALQFSPDSRRLAYSVRELITSEEWPAPRGLRARDFAQDVRVVSHCVDAGLVIDGSVSFPFNDGTVAFLQTLPQDALRTVVMDEQDA